MKLKLEHLAPYLPYRLKCKTEHGFTTMESLNDFCINIDHEDSYSYEDHPDQKLEFKPILCPLSDLTKEIEHNGRTFVPYETKVLVDFMTEVEGMDCLCECDHDISINPDVSYYVITALIEWHFDVFGLIDAGLAIKKQQHTLKQK